MAAIGSPSMDPSRNPAGSLAWNAAGVVDARVPALVGGPSQRTWRSPATSATEIDSCAVMPRSYEPGPGLGDPTQPPRLAAERRLGRPAALNRYHRGLARL